MIDNKNKMLFCGLTFILLVGQSSRAVFAEQIVESPRPTSTVSMQLPDENKYDTDLSITRLDIFVKTDFQSNNVDTVVKASVENFSDNPVDTAEFWLCPGMNDRDLSADIKHIYFLDKDGKKDLKYTVREIEGRNFKRIHVVSFERPVKPGEKLELEFEYTMKGKPDHSSAPIWQSKDRVKELFLRGDFHWCPTFYVESKKDVFPRLYRPDWKLSIEYPAGYVGVADGELVRREEKDGVVKEEWKSLINNYPQVFISKYKLERRTGEGVTLEIYAPDEELLKEGSDKFDDYAKIFNLYIDLYGHPGSSIYRIIASPSLEGGALGLAMGLVMDKELLDGTQYVAHEMAHTWWGTLVTSYGEGSKFLREAMAEFSSAYAMSHLGAEIDGESRFLYIRRRRFCFYIGIANPPKLRPLIQQEGYDAAKVTMENYRKGPLVLNQIRLILGDEVFFQCLKAFLTKHRGKTVNIHDFINTINRLSGRDMTSDLKNLLWSAGYPSYRLVGFESVKKDGGYRTKVRIHNEGEYGLSCPLLLKMKGGGKREMFKVDGKDEGQFVFTTDEKVIDVVIDPELTAFQYHPQQRARLWMSVKPRSFRNWIWYGKSHMYYLVGEHKKAISTITEYFSRSMERKKYKNIEELVDGSSLNAAYLFMRGIYYLALDDREHAEKDIELAFPPMLEALLGMLTKPSWQLTAYRCAGVIPEEDLDQYLALLSQIAGRELSFEVGLDEEKKKQKVGEWKQWWEKKGKYQKLDISTLKERFAGRDAALDSAKEWFENSGQIKFAPEAGLLPIAEVSRISVIK